MLCQNCGKNNATSHIHSVINGVVKDKYLCSECAAAENADNFYENDIFKMLSSFLSDGAVQRFEGIKCECCGTTYDTVKRTGRVGCGNCYKVFEQQLKPALVRIHGRTVHVGKRPDGECETNAVQSTENPEKSKLEALKKQLKEAIANEEYEKAAVLRDEIRREE